MNDKDKKAFEKWVKSEDTRIHPEGREGYFANNNNFTRDYWIAEKAWQAACEYMQAGLAHHIFKIEAENKKLREALEFTLYCAEYLIRPEKELSHELYPTSYLTLSYEGDLDLINKCKKAREALKEVGKE